MNVRAAAQRVWYRFARRWVQVAESIACFPQYTGLDNVPSKGPVLLAANHQSHLDPPLVGAGCPRSLNYLARESLFRFAPFAGLIRSFNAIPLDREGTGLAGIKETLRRLKRGEAVLLFPEGTRTRDGNVGRFRPGFTTLAVRSRASIVPVAIEGAYQAWPRSQTLPGPGIIHIHFGQPIAGDELRDYSDQQLVDEVERRVRFYHSQLRRHPAFSRA